LPLNERFIFSEVITLTAAHVSVLESHTAEFRAASRKGQDKIVKEVAEYIEQGWLESVEFDKVRVMSVRDPSA
jgi:hypothetical protein